MLVVAVARLRVPDLHDDGPPRLRDRRQQGGSRAAGIRIRRIVIGAFIVNGLLVGLAGVLEASLYGSPDATFGIGFELQVITAVIVGGVSFAGGEGGVVRAMLGALLLEAVSGVGRVRSASTRTGPTSSRARS